MSGKCLNTNRRILLEKIARLGTTEHDEIFKILARNNLPFTQNSNGVFFNFSGVCDEIISEIETFVSYCEKNQQELDAYDKKINSSLLNHTAQNQPDDLDSVLQSKDEHDDIIKEMVQTSDKVKHFVNMLENNLERIHKKSSTTKFFNAKKRYSRRIISDKKTYDFNCNLYKEEVNTKLAIV